MRSVLRCALVSLVALTGCVTDELPGDEPDDPRPGGKADDGDDWGAIAARCAPPAEGEAVVYSNDFRWWYTRDEMATRFDEIYASGKRLADRAYYDADADTFILPHVPAWGGRVLLSRRLVDSVRAHLEKALARGYAEFVFFPDMGHSHFFIPEQDWQQSYAGTPTDQLSDMYSRLFDDPELLVLYHTAEQLQTHTEEGALLPDEHLHWRFYTRNPVGDNRGQGTIDIHRDLESSGNTVRDYAGHHYLGAGFNISASADGCFPYVVGGELRYFDISLSDLPYRNDGGGGGDF